MMPPISSQNWPPDGIRLPSGVFINDVHEPSAHILESPIQAHSDTQATPVASDPDARSVLGGSYPSVKPALGGSDPSTSMTTSPTNVAVLALDQND